MKQQPLFLFIMLFMVCIVTMPFPLSAVEEQAPTLVIEETIPEYNFNDAVKSGIGFVSLGVSHDAQNAVEKQVDLFSGRIKDRFGLYLSRSGKYITLMRDILSQMGLPEDLAFLPLIESGFSMKAYSRMKAAGPWQFIASTGNYYGLKINWWVDERRDPVKSTTAAGQYLSDLYLRFGSWDLALAAYNAGERKVYRALKKAKTPDYWVISSKKNLLKRETRDYVPKFVAARLIAENPEEFGFDDIEYHDILDYEEIVVPSPIDLEKVAEVAGIKLEELKELNPELLRWCTPPDMPEYKLNVPTGVKEILTDNYGLLQRSETCKIITYKVRKGDTLQKVSKKTGIPAKTIISMNSLKKKQRLRPGLVLYLPPKNKVDNT